MIDSNDRVGQVIRKFMHQRLKTNYMAGNYTVEELQRLLAAPSCFNPRFGGNAYTEQDEAFFANLLGRLEPTRNPRCTVDHQGGCTGACD